MLRTIQSAAKFSIVLKLAVFAFLALIALVSAEAQTDCTAGAGTLETTPPKDMTPEALIQKFTGDENKIKDARSHYTYTQDVLVQTLNDKTVSGQYHQVTSVSYDDKGQRIDKVTYDEQSTLRDISLSADDKEDVRVFMPWMVTSDEAQHYKLTYAGQQHVDDLDTYVFHVEPKTIEKKQRYFQGRIWVDNRDFAVVKLCGKTVPEERAKKNQAQEVRPTFAGYRQLIDGYWFPAYASVDDTLHFGAQSIHVREIVKFKDYKRTGTTSTASKP